MKFLLTIIIFLLFCVSCSNDQLEGGHECYYRSPPFSEEQLTWVKNIEKPRYKFITEIRDSNGLLTYKTDTVIGVTQMSVTKQSGDCGDGGTATWYSGKFRLQLKDFSSEIEITNGHFSGSSLQVEIDQLQNVQGFPTDTALINGLIFNNVYKLPYSRITFWPNGYFKRGVGFLYLQLPNNCKAYLIDK